MNRRVTTATIRRVSAAFYLYTAIIRTNGRAIDTRTVYVEIGA